MAACCLNWQVPEPAGMLVLVTQTVHQHGHFAVLQQQEPCRVIKTFTDIWGDAAAVKCMVTCRTAVSPVVWRHLEAAWKQAAVDRRDKPRKGTKQQDSPPPAAAAPADGLSERWEAASKLYACTAGH